jgi:addiction module RelB/DinJ family antitoxin
VLSLLRIRDPRNADAALEAAKADSGVLPQSISLESFVAQDELLCGHYMICMTSNIQTMTSTSTTLQVRLSRKLRDNAASALEEMGLDLPTAVRLFFTNVAKTRRIPFLLEADPRAEVLEVDSSTQASMDRIAKVWKKTKPRR